MIRMSPSLSPWIARFKCKKIIAHHLKSLKSNQHDKVVEIVKNLIGGNKNSNDLINQEVSFLVFMLRVLSPLITNSISALVFELCLDSTVIVSLNDFKIKEKELKDMKEKKINAYTPFSSLVRFKIIEEIEIGLFKNEGTDHFSLFRKLALLNLMTILMIIKDMSKMYIESAMIAKLYKEYANIKRDI